MRAGLTAGLSDRQQRVMQFLCALHPGVVENSQHLPAVQAALLEGEAQAAGFGQAASQGVRCPH